MKKYISVLAIIFIISLAACSNQNTSSTPTSNENNTQSNSVTKLDVTPDEINAEIAAVRAARKAVKQ